MGMEKEPTEDLCACMRGIGNWEPLQDLKQGSNMSYDLLFKKVTLDLGVYWRRLRGEDRLFGRLRDYVKR